MRKRHQVSAVCVFCLVITISGAGCASIKTYEKLEQPADTVLETHLNGQIFKVLRSSDLPNAFGKADAFGGKVDRGFVELRYLGLSPDGRLRLRITDVDTTSTETTMSRYGAGQTRLSSTTTTTLSGSWIVATGVYIPPPEGRTEVLPPNTLEFLYAYRAGALPIAGLEIAFVGATEVSVSYRLRTAHKR